MQQFLIEYGLLAVFCCAVLENDVTFILTGVVIQQIGGLHPVLGVIYGVAGALTHDSLWYWLGHSRSERIRRGRVYRRMGAAVERLADRFGPAELFYCRFIYGARIPSVVFWGIQRLSYWKFLAIETVSLLLWGSFLTAFGYFLSDRAMVVFGHVKSIENWLLGAALLIAATVVGMRIFARHEFRKRLSARPDR